jgi:hypothetical protein
VDLAVTTLPPGCMVATFYLASLVLYPYSPKCLEEEFSEVRQASYTFGPTGSIGAVGVANPIRSSVRNCHDGVHNM